MKTWQNLERSITILSNDPDSFLEADERPGSFTADVDPWSCRPMISRVLSNSATAPCAVRFPRVKLHKHVSACGTAWRRRRVFAKRSPQLGLLPTMLRSTWIG